MTRRKLLAAIGATAVLGSTTLLAAEAEPADRAPTLSIHEAIKLAEDHIKEKKVEVTGYHLASAIYQPGTERPHWALTWKSDKRMKGGFFVIVIRPDKSVETRAGE